MVRMGSGYEVGPRGGRFCLSFRKVKLFNRRNASGFFEQPVELGHYLPMLAGDVALFLRISG